MRFHLIVISSPVTTEREIDHVLKLFENGLRFFHLRKPGMTEEMLRAYLRQIPQKYHSRIVIHSHYRLIHEFKLKGIHLTETSRREKSTQQFIARHQPRHISASFHAMKDIKNAKRKYTYVFLSPVFDSISKKNYTSGFDLLSLKKALKAVKEKQMVIALGGIDSSTITKVKEADFKGAAMLGNIWESGDPVKNFRRVLLKIQ